MCGYITTGGNTLAKFHGNIFNLSENIAKCFKGAMFFDSHSDNRITDSAIARVVTSKPWGTQTKAVGGFDVLSECGKHRLM